MTRPNGSCSECERRACLTFVGFLILMTFVVWVLAVLEFRAGGGKPQPPADQVLYPPNFLPIPN